MKKLILTLSLVVFLFGFVGCKEDDGNAVLSGGRTSTWECIIENYRSPIPTIITLTIDSATNVVSVSKSPKEERPLIDDWHQFNSDFQYRLQGDSLYYLKAYEGLGTGTFHETVPPFLITKLSEDEMRLDFNWGLPAYPEYISVYFFVRVKE